MYSTSGKTAKGAKKVNYQNNGHLRHCMVNRYLMMRTHVILRWEKKKSATYAQLCLYIITDLWVSTDGG